MEKLYFNLDLTLTEMNRTFDECFEDTLEELNIRDEKIDAGRYSEIFFEIFGSMEPNPREKTFRKYFEEKNIDSEPEKASGIYKNKELEAVEPVEELKRTLEELSEDFRLGIVTAGTTELQKKKLEKLGITEIFEDVLITYEEGKSKRRILNELGDNSIYFSNSDSDIEKAEEAGVKSVNSDFTSAGKIRSEVGKL